MKACSFVFLWSAAALAQPSPETLRWVQGSLHPGIRVRDTGSRGKPCEPFTVNLTGLDPVTSQPRLVTAAIYAPASGEARDVLVLPPTGGEGFFDRAYAQALCAAGARASILEHWDLDVQRDVDLATWDRGSIRTLAAAEHLLEYLAPTQPVAILGTSLGALGSAFVLGFDARVDTAVLIVGGDHLSDIIAHTTEPGVAGVRAKQMQALGLSSIDDYEHALRAAIRVDPGTFADFNGEKKLLMFVGTADDTVPTKNQLELVQAFGQPRVDSYPGSHFETILHTYWQHEGEVVSFLAGKAVLHEPARWGKGLK
jgi:hypothetical protein